MAYCKFLMVIILGFLFNRGERRVFGVYLKLCFVAVFAASCSSGVERQLSIISQEYISEEKVDDWAVLYVSESESDSIMRVFRISSFILFVDLELEITSYEKILGGWVLYDLQYEKSMCIPSVILEDKQTDLPITAYDPAEWIILMCRETGDFRIVKDASYMKLSEIPEYERFRNKCLKARELGDK